jgi:DNA-binding protein H-NS
MKKYRCIACNFSTDHRPNFQRHIRTSKHKKCSSNVALCSSDVALCSPNVAFSEEIPSPKKVYECKYCKKVLQHHTSLSRHIKYSCKQNKDEDLKELARLFNEKEKKMNTNDSELVQQMQKMQKQIDKLTNKLQIQNINKGTVNNTNNTINIQLLNHSDTDYSHLTPKDYLTCIKNCNYCVKSLIEKVHFNPEKPENMNIFLSNIKGNYVMVYKDNEWQIRNKQRQIDDLYDSNEFVLETWYDEYKEKYPHIINSFQKYLKNKDEDVVLNRVKDEILMMLYNNRRMIPSE